jgi:putative transposase
MILGSRTSTSMTTPLVLDAVEHAIWTRGRRGAPIWVGWSITPTPAQYHLGPVLERLAEAGIRASVGTVGDSFDNALAETHA